MLSVEKQILFLLSRADHLESKELIQIYEKRGFSAQYIRNVLSRLKKEEYIISPFRSAYSITDSGKNFIDSINQKPRNKEKWGGDWLIVMVEFPESQRKKRDKFRNDILQLGFGLLYNSVYISPWNYQKEINQLIDKHNISEHVTLILGSILRQTITSERAYDIWKLKEVERMYEKKWEWFTNKFLTDTDNLLQSNPEPIDLFVQFLHLGEEMTGIFLEDPMLPEELLPKNWKGKWINEQFWNEINRIISAIPKDSRYLQFV